jgi:hypothetical protein
MLDKLPPQVRHAIIALLGALFTWAVSLSKTLHLSAPYSLLLGTVITSAGLILTPLTNQYGIATIDKDGKPVIGKQN